MYISFNFQNMNIMKTVILHKMKLPVYILLKITHKYISVLLVLLR